MSNPVGSAGTGTGGVGVVTLLVGGEACPAEVVDRWAPGRVMINEYGPTETTMWVTIEFAAGSGVEGGADRFAGVGDGVVCARWVVTPGASGVVGELYVAGHGVGMGYWRR